MNVLLIKGSGDIVSFNSIGLLSSRQLVSVQTLLLEYLQASMAISSTSESDWAWLPVSKSMCSRHDGKKSLKLRLVAKN